MVYFFQTLIRFYSFLISPLLGRNCRYHPTCSCYAHEALEKHGVLKGLWLTVWRVLNCHPWSKRNWHDPVPERFAWREVLLYKRCSDENIVIFINFVTSLLRSLCRFTTLRRLRLVTKLSKTTIEDVILVKKVKNHDEQ